MVHLEDPSLPVELWRLMGHKLDTREVRVPAYLHGRKWMGERPYWARSVTIYFSCWVHSHEFRPTKNTKRLPFSGHLSSHLKDVVWHKILLQGEENTGTWWRQKRWCMILERSRTSQIDGGRWKIHKKHWGGMGKLSVDTFLSNDKLGKPEIVPQHNYMLSWTEKRRCIKYSFRKLNAWSHLNSAHHLVAYLSLWSSSSSSSIIRRHMLVWIRFF